jgi:molecular chaperone GrpE
LNNGNDLMDHETGGIVDKRASSRMRDEAQAPDGDLPRPDEPQQEQEQVAKPELQAQLEEERGRAQSYYANWQRSAADFQNYKRRVEKEQQETARYASVAFVFNLLPVLDDLERAMDNLDATLAGLNWVQGIAQIQSKLRNLLASYGVEEIAADGAAFDPAQHEAISQAPGEEGHVVAVAQKGYRLGERIIRPALVVVGKGE